MIDGQDTKYYRHTIHKFDFTVLEGLNKWTAYRVTKNIYDEWLPAHFKRLCSAIDQLPSNLDFDVAPLPAVFSHELGNTIEDDELSNAVEQEATPDTQSNIRPEVAKRRRG